MDAEATRDRSVGGAPGALPSETMAQEPETATTIRFRVVEGAGGTLGLEVDGDAGVGSVSLDRHRLAALVGHPVAGESPEASRGELDGLWGAAPGGESAVRELGRHLFDLLRSGEIRGLIDEHLGRLKGQQELTLRWRFSFDLKDRSLRWLGEIPWELIWKEDWGHFALDRRFSVVRSLELPESRHQRLPLAPLRVLAVASNPYGTEPLDLPRELARIREAVGDQEQVELHHLSLAEPERLRQRLLEEPVHAVHFMGHGYSRPGGEAGLILESSDRGAVPVSSQEWVELVADVSPGLVVLNACDTARSGSPEQEPFHGVAQALVRAGVPAVVAMGAPVRDVAAIDLARTLYGRLAQRDTLDQALVEARKAVRRLLPGEMAWAIPKLFDIGARPRYLIAAEKDEPPTGWSAELDLEDITGEHNRATVADLEDRNSAEGLRAKARVKTLGGQGNSLTGVVIRGSRSKGR